MNIKLAFTPVSQTPLDLLVVVLDPERTLHQVDDAALRAHVDRAGAAFREKTLKREYLATLPEGSAAKALVVYWSPHLKSWNLWENVKTFTARALRLASDYRWPRVGIAVNTADAAPLVGKVVEGAVVGAYTFDRYKKEKDDFLQREAQVVVLAHPDHQADAEARKARYAWVSENVNRCRDLINEPGSVVTPEFLADRAGEEGATHVVDIATLTGACLRALGPSVAGIMGTDADLIRRVIRSGERHGEAFWELPLVDEYREALKTPFADINNIAAGGLAGAITAGLFLREFVPEKVAWAHLDIAGPMFRDKDWKYYEAGAVGFGVKTLVDLCERFHDPQA